MRGAVIIPSVLAAACVSCHAQEQFVFSWMVQDVAGPGPTNSNGIIEPGEDARVRLSVSMQPGISGPAIWNTLGGTGQVGIVGGLGFVECELRGTQNLHTGTWFGSTYPSGFNLGLGASVLPNNDLAGIGFGQFLFPGQAPDPRNDDWFFQTIWRPMDYAPRNVAFRFRRGPDPEAPYVLLDVGMRDPQGSPIYKPDTWAYNEPTGGFVVVPTPASAALITVACVVATRTRRYRRT